MDRVTEHILDVLQTVRRILGFSNRDLERKLGLSASYLTRLFSGAIVLRVDHIVRLSTAMGLRPEELFLLAFPATGEPSSEAFQRLQSSLYGFQAPEPPQAGPAGDAELERLLEKILRRILGA